ncbi:MULTISPECIES: mycothiol system anti-sigma-R factor [unclassified Pseudactinotalea]|uniref:mycothiol system anti-sigma-R factor n=1 Tax=unclassified Pseudactinotalea TaxID=2649176 RepID=UPI00128BD7B8|nr:MULTISPECIES: mycothiol system anti-sigma-R factor [unclassified Pseudactinotalea]MPV48894.1 mycothiol system anti-sigma-R factor [Pseudactinotalea sp. HY160]QGH68870.1 mycothiol system anti-sigma-R factor [Pseudactinotalea sp. HY158]
MTADPQAREPREDDCQCEEALAHLQEYIDCEMSEVDTVRLRVHITTCLTCQDEVGVEQWLRRMLRRSCVEEAPADLRERVLTQITAVRAAVVRGSGPH